VEFDAELDVLSGRECLEDLACGVAAFIIAHRSSANRAFTRELDFDDLVTAVEELSCETEERGDSD
jgi:hypothetical protein